MEQADKRLNYIRSSLFLTFIVLFLAGSLFINPQVLAEGIPGERDMIRQRLRSDLKELQQEYDELEEKCAAYRRRIRELEEQPEEAAAGDTNDRDELLDRLEETERENRRLHRINRELQRSNAELEERIVDVQQTDSSEKQVASDDSSPRAEFTIEDEVKRIIEEDQDSEWVTRGRSYPVRREPLNYEKEYYTTHVDTLSRLAHQYYLDGTYWYKLYKANEDRIANPNALPSGTRLRLPPIEELEKIER